MSLKRFYMLVLVFILIAIMGIIVNADTNKIGYVNANALNLRAEPNTNSKILNSLNNGESVIILKSQDGWINVKYNNIDGWLFSQYVLIQDNDKQEPVKEEPVKVEGKINAQGVNIRSQANLESKVIVILNKDTNIEITGEEEFWYQIEYNKEKCYVYKTFVSIKNVYVGQGIVNVDDVIIREKSDSGSMEIDKINKGEKISILVNFGDWFKISYGDKSGWIFSEMIDATGLKNIWGYVDGQDVNMRDDPKLDSKIIVKLKQNTSVKIFSRYGEWYRIQAGELFGWMHIDLVKIDYSMSDRGYVKDVYPDIESNEVNSKIQELISFSKKFLGVNYVWGGESPSGFDCSGFTLYIYKHLGVYLPHKASLQGREGSYVSRNDLQPGDLIFFETNSKQAGIDHGGMYIGNGQFIHASSSRTQGSYVRISNLNTGYYNTAFLSARRIINE